MKLPGQSYLYPVGGCESPHHLQPSLAWQFALAALPTWNEELQAPDKVRAIALQDFNAKMHRICSRHPGGNGL